jgi:peptidyl-prolyl cis-trans isomerase SurA
MNSSALLCAVVACTLVLGGCKRTAPATVAAEVNSRPITYSDIDKQLELQFAGAQERPTGDELAIRKMELLRTMIDSEILLQRAEKLSLMATDADVEAKLNELKAPYTVEEFQKQLQMRKITLDDLKAQIRRQLSETKLINKEITSRISISDEDIAAFYNSNKASFNLPEPQIRLAQIVVTPMPDPNIRNLRNDNATSEDSARTKIQTIEARLHQGEDFHMLAQNLSEDPNSAPNGGDLGFWPESALEKADPMLRKLVSGLQPGQTSGVIRTPDGYRIIKLIVREPAGQRQLSDPAVQQSIRERLMNQKDQLLRNAYYEVARNEAKVVNYYANSIVENRQASGK